MRHMDDKFNRIQDPAQLIPEDEPVFLLRAQDKTAFAAVSYWASLQKDDKKAADAVAWSLEMAKWPVKKDAD